MSSKTKISAIINSIAKSMQWISAFYVSPNESYVWTPEVVNLGSVNYAGFAWTVT